MIVSGNTDWIFLQTNMVTYVSLFTSIGFYFYLCEKANNFKFYFSNYIPVLDLDSDSN